MLRKLILSLFVLSVGTACAGTPHVGDKVEVRGTLTIRGNEPFTYPVVSTSAKVWQLVGVERASAMKLQNRIVHVTGHVAANAVPSGLPAIQVDSVTEGDAKAP
ncbi:exported hypothetical protein [Paraburkholderia ribeironis]|uniref:Uncharacterized protein n=1 Tax=Paraburkholderia ribeironis TaxID=1247936 RepID=A0A1N7RLT9_9BURK|nr:hypothetical protein [Paraburkholderia ribeironis]SIT35667.1 exported hypothetical protein [Paraburkholderia ribeironis]